jgi:hypothetical protein
MFPEVMEMRLLLVVALMSMMVGSVLGYGVGLTSTTHPPPPSSAVARYMAGVQRLDGTEMWASMSPDARAQAIHGGDSPADFAAFYDQLKARGGRIDQVQYVGGYQTKEKGLFIYVTRHLDPGNDPLETVWVLVTGPEGLVDDVL